MDQGTSVQNPELLTAMHLQCASNPRNLAAKHERRPAGAPVAISCVAGGDLQVLATCQNCTSSTFGGLAALANLGALLRMRLVL